MRTPKSVRKADLKKNWIIESKDATVEFGNITIFTNQIKYESGEVARVIAVYKTGAQRCPWEDNYEEDIENYEFDNANEANEKFLELVRKYHKNA